MHSYIVFVKAKGADDSTLCPGVDFEFLRVIQPGDVLDLPWPFACKVKVNEVNSQVFEGKTVLTCERVDE
jgi:hypothetical protein